MTATATSTISTPTRTINRETARIDAIRSAAIVRQALGQAATHRRLRDGSHEITVGGKSSTAATLDQAIREARGGAQ
jgi:hypothetical protein